MAEVHDSDFICCAEAVGCRVDGVDVDFSIVLVHKARNCSEMNDAVAALESLHSVIVFFFSAVGRLHFCIRSAVVIFLCTVDLDGVMAGI